MFEWHIAINVGFTITLILHDMTKWQKHYVHDKNRFQSTKTQLLKLLTCLLKHKTFTHTRFSYWLVLNIMSTNNVCAPAKEKISHVFSQPNMFQSQWDSNWKYKCITAFTITFPSRLVNENDTVSVLLTCPCSQTSIPPPTEKLRKWPGQSL